MTSNSPTQPGGKKDRRRAAQEKAQAARAAEARRRRRDRLLLQGGISAGILAVVAVIVITVLTVGSMNTATAAKGAAPAHTSAGGITIGTGGKLATTRTTGTTAKPLVRTYEDFICSSCGEFEAANATYLASLVDAGKMTLEIYPISILDADSNGTKYSTRAAASAGCVANYSPDHFFAFHRLLYAHQPVENSSGLTDTQLEAYARQAGATPTAAIDRCIEHQTYADWVTATTDRISANGIPDAGGAKFSGTPTIIINSHLFTGNFASRPAVTAAITAASTPTSSSTP